MMMVKPLAKGTLHITDEVVAIIAEAAVNETVGVAGTTSRFRDEFIRVVSKNPTRGITVQSLENETEIEVKVSLFFGVNIREVCFEMQERIKREVEMMTGVAVAAVHVYVEQIVPVE